MGDQMNIDQHLRSYIEAFSTPVRDIFESFDFYTQIDRLKKANLLCQRRRNGQTVRTVE